MPRPASTFALGILTLTLLLSTSLASALTEQPNITQLEIASYRLSSQFSAFVFFEGDDRYRQQLVDSRKNISQQITELGLIPISDAWQACNEFVTEKEQHVFDGTDQRLQIKFNIHNNQVYRAIEQLKSENKLPSNTTQVSLLTLQLEKILAVYMASISSNMGGIYTGQSLPEMTEDFSQQISQLKNQKQLQGKLLRKWNFIKKNLVDTEQQAAPYITLYTIDNIRKILQQMKA